MNAPDTKLFKVEADPVTGEWISKPSLIGEVNWAEFIKLQDSDSIHYGVYERQNREADAEGFIDEDRYETCAIEIHWITEEDGEAA